MKVVDIIPVDIQETILLENYIDNAIPIIGDESMYYLMIVWRNYLEPNLAVNCNLCLTRILKEFKALRPYMIEKVKTENLLNDY